MSFESPVAFSFYYPNKTFFIITFSLLSYLNDKLVHLSNLTRKANRHKALERKHPLKRLA